MDKEPPRSPSFAGPEETALTTRTELRELSDNKLLARLHYLPRDSEQRAAICEIVVVRYTRLVSSCVRHYSDSPEPAEDLMQDGYVGLLKAINNFDPQVGDSLSAYAQPYINGEVKRHFRDKRWQIHVRRQAQELMLRLRQANEEMTQQLGRAPGDRELAVRLNITEDDLREAREADLAFRTYSLDAPVPGWEDPAPLAERFGQEDLAIEHALDMEAVNAHRDELPEREQRILILRFYGNLSQTEIAARLGISHMHVSRLLRKALGYLRNQLIEPVEAT